MPGWSAEFAVLLLMHYVRHAVGSIQERCTGCMHAVPRAPMVRQLFTDLRSCTCAGPAATLDSQHPAAAAASNGAAALTKNQKKKLKKKLKKLPDGAPAPLDEDSAAADSGALDSSPSASGIGLGLGKNEVASQPPLPQEGASVGGPAVGAAAGGAGGGGAAPGDSVGERGARPNCMAAAAQAGDGFDGRLALERVHNGFVCKLVCGPSVSRIVCGILTVFSAFCGALGAAGS